MRWDESSSGWTRSGSWLSNRCWGAEFGCKSGYSAGETTVYMPDYDSILMENSQFCCQVKKAHNLAFFHAWEMSNRSSERHRVEKRRWTPLDDNNHLFKNIDGSFRKILGPLGRQISKYRFISDHTRSMTLCPGKATICEGGGSWRWMGKRNPGIYCGKVKEQKNLTSEH